MLIFTGSCHIHIYLSKVYSIFSVGYDLNLLNV